jgi:hypothetical protein
MNEDIRPFNNTNPPPVVGGFRRFGALGPVYEIMRLDEARGQAHVRVVTSGEEIDYPLAQLLADPKDAD